jgi:hypothetical protein
MESSDNDPMPFKPTAVRLSRSLSVLVSRDGQREKWERELCRSGIYREKPPALEQVNQCSDDTVLSNLISWYKYYDRWDIESQERNRPTIERLELEMGAFWVVCARRYNAPFLRRAEFSNAADRLEKVIKRFVQVEHC